MSDDLVERLRASTTQARALDRAALLHEAADEIERLQCNIDAMLATNAMLRGAWQRAREICGEANRPEARRKRAKK